MLCAGDEMGRSQKGNNNAYCQDNEISWVNWNLASRQQDLLTFTQFMIELRKTQPVLKKRKFFQGRSIRGAGVKDIAWFEPNGREMNDNAWNTPFVRCLGVFLNGTDLDQTANDKDSIDASSMFLMFNAHHESLTPIAVNTLLARAWPDDPFARSP